MGKKRAAWLGDALVLLCVAGAITCDVLRTLNQQEPAHGQLGGLRDLLLAVALLVWFLL